MQWFGGSNAKIQKKPFAPHFDNDWGLLLICEIGVYANEVYAGLIIVEKTEFFALNVDHIKMSGSYFKKSINSKCI